MGSCDVSSTAMILFSIISALSSLSILLSFHLFWKNLGRKPLMLLVYYIQWSNFLTSIGSMVGEPASASFACWFEGITTNIFSLSSNLWSLVINFLLFSILFCKKPMQIRWIHHMLCWGLPIVVTCLPLINSTYGAPDGINWCWVVSTPSSPYWAPLFWYWMSFYAWIWLGFVIDVSMIVALIFQFMRLAPSTLNKVRKAFRTRAGYPFIVLICWGGSAVTDFLTYQNPSFKLSCRVGTFVVVLECSSGFLSSIYFWYNESTFRSEWAALAGFHFSLTKYRRFKLERFKRYNVAQIRTSSRPQSPDGVGGRNFQSGVVHVRTKNQHPTLN